MGLFKRKTIEELKAKRKRLATKYKTSSERAMVKRDIRKIKRGRRAVATAGVRSAGRVVVKSGRVIAKGVGLTYKAGERISKRFDANMGASMMGGGFGQPQRRKGKGRKRNNNYMMGL